ncbi:MAG: NBR1-Ig-like domain-containing protein [Anaerolineales bacterium]
MGLSLAWLILLSACNYPAGARQEGGGVMLSATNAASTVAAQITQDSVATVVPPSPLATATPPAEKATAVPTATQVQPTLPPTPTPIPCNWGQFLDDVTIPDGKTLPAGESFTKTWRLKNTGSCVWTKNYDLVYSSGDRMAADRVIPLVGSTKPGESVDVSVKLTAPSQSGHYTGYWALRDDAGRVFGVGSSASTAFWVDIRVERAKKVVYDLVDHYCDADWRDGSGFLACPGKPESDVSFVTMLEEPVLEGDRHENEPGLWAELAAEDNAWMSGEYPAFEIEKGDEFRAVVSCAAEAEDCDVRFRLEYRIGSATVRTLLKADERSEGKFRSISVDLSDLAGEKVGLILSVQARSLTSDNSAIWLSPRIMR